MRRVRRAASTTDTVPAVVYLHGGGFRAGSAFSPQTTAAVVERLDAVDCEVVCPDYRRAPAHPFPAALDDVVATITGLLDVAGSWSVDPGRVVLDGYSAGGNLAAAAVIELHTRTRLRIRGLVLEAPRLDFRPGAPWDAAYERLGQVLPREAVATLYLQGHDVGDPLVSPLATECLRLLPRTHVVTAQRDPLRPSGLAMVDRLVRDGVEVTATVHVLADHATPDELPRSPRARAWAADVTAAISELLDLRQ